MNASVKPPQSPADASLVESFEALRASGVAPAQEEAFARFLSKGLPGRRIEAWHYTDLRTQLKRAPLPAGAASGASVVEGATLIFADGALVGEPKAPQGVSIERATSGRRLATPVIDEDDASIALARAFSRETITIRVEANATCALRFVFQNAETAATSAAHVILQIGAGASFTLMESHDSAAGAGHFAQSFIEFDAGEQSKVNHIRINSLDAAASCVSTLGVDLAARAKFDTLSLTTGAALSRHQIFLRFSGEHAKASICGATLVRGRQHADTAIIVNHAAANGESREVYKTIVDDEATGVFQGRINVAPGAQKTDARMASNAMLLAEGAAMYNKPELEIFADDVQCAHGATCGELDDDLLFYIMARGLPRREAEALLLEAFVAPAFDNVEDEDTRETLMERVRGWLAQRK